MKKIVGLFLVLAITVFVSSSVFASVDRTYKAVAVFSSSVGEVSFDMVLKYIDGDASASAIDWDVENIPLNIKTTNWTTSTVYGVVSSTVYSLP